MWSVYCNIPCVFLLFFFSSRRRHTRCALVTGVQTCALPISPLHSLRMAALSSTAASEGSDTPMGPMQRVIIEKLQAHLAPVHQIGRASCRERVCQYV